MSHAITFLRAGALITWLLSPPLLCVLALRDWHRKTQAAGIRMPLPLTLGTVLLADWVSFLYIVLEGQTPYGSHYRPSLSTFILLLLPVLVCIVATTAAAGRVTLSLAGAVLVTLWVCIVYAPAHWMTRVDIGRVTVDNHAVPATVYMGYPTDSEAESVVLVRFQNGTDYFLDFGSEKVRRGRRSDYVFLLQGVWCFKSMQDGPFVEPLHTGRLNEFRILSLDGHIVSVQF